jgi:hypothetical protein
MRCGWLKEGLQQRERVIVRPLLKDGEHVEQRGLIVAERGVAWALVRFQS